MSVHQFDGPGARDAAGIDEADEQRPPMPVEENPLASLRAALSQPVDDDIVPIKHPGRDVTVRFNSRFSFDELARWRRGAKDQSQPGGVNLLRMACIVLANASIGMLIGDREVNAGDGTPMTLRSPELREIHNTIDSIETVRAFYDYRDGWAIATMTTLLDAAGYGAEVEVDPTKTGRN